jgi:hypothetical protein
VSVLVLTNAKVLLAQADLSGFSNKVELMREVEELDSTVFADDGFRSKVGGLSKVSGSVSGFWEAGSDAHPDDRFWADLGAASLPLTVSPTGATVADVAYLTRVLQPKYTQGGDVGALLAFQASVVGDGTPLARGQVAFNGTATATATTAALTLSAPTATQRVYAAIHVLSVSGAGASLTVSVQGDDASGFPSPATVATSDAITSAGATWLAGEVGATTDSFYRLSFLISGTSPEFVVVAAIGVA